MFVFIKSPNIDKVLTFHHPYCFRHFSSVQFSHLVVSNSLRPHDSQHARPPCPSPTPRVHSDSHPSMKLRHLYLGRKVMTNLDSIFKIRDITLSTKVCLVMAMVFPVVMYGCESWTVKKAERWRIDASELWCWRRLESPLDCKEIKPGNPKGNKS